jgi:hypothetical protein
MTTVHIPGPCPYCGCDKYARITNINVEPLVPEEARASMYPHHAAHPFALVMCVKCGNATWFSQNPEQLLEAFGVVETDFVQVNVSGEPYR